MDAATHAQQFVGLINTGATCYLNSLLQSLFFTPEFRRAILFTFHYDSSVYGAEALCIPRQLQLLFARLLCSRRSSVGTEALTASFRWTSSDHWRQHDIQELMRVLFAALEKSLSRPVSASVINTAAPSPESSPLTRSPLSPSSSRSRPISQCQSFLRDLYCGRMIDYIECLQCHHRRHRVDDFMDLSLDVGNCHTLEQALQRYCQSETLTGSNQWLCEQCQCKVDATKGLAFQSLPSMLTLQLKRFVYDCQSMQRVKLQHRLTFPDTINLNVYVINTDTDTGSDRCSTVALYDLFAVLMHAGTASGGHYWSLIKHDSHFIECNDSQTSQAGDSALEVAYGDNKMNASAYMLIYRSRELETGSQCPTPLSLVTDTDAANVPNLRDASHYEQLQLSKDIRDIVEAEDAKLFEKQRLAELERRSIELIVHYQQRSVTVKIDSELTVGDCLATVQSQITELLSVPSDRLRLRVFDSALQWPKQPLDSSLSLAHYQLPKRSCVMVETLDECDGGWPVYDDSLIPVRNIVVTADNARPLIEAGNDVYAHPALTRHFVSLAHSIGTLTQSVAGVNGSDGVRLIRYCIDKCHLLDNNGTVESQSVQPGDVILVEPLSPPASQPFLALFDCIKNEIRIAFNLPSESDEPSFDNTLTINKYATLTDLKASLAPMIALPAEAFTLARNSAIAEWRDLAQSLAGLGLVDCSAVYVRQQAQRSDRDITVRLYYLTQPLYTFAPLTDIEVPRTLTIAQLKPLIAALLPPAMIGRPFRVREKRGNMSNKIYELDAVLDSVSISGATSVDVAVQCVDSDDDATLPPSATLVKFQLLADRSKSLHSEMHEIFLRRSTTIEEMKKLIVETLPQSVTIDSLVSLGKGLSTRKMLKADVDRVKFEPINDSMKNKLARNPPLSLRAGDLLIVKYQRPPASSPSPSQPQPKVVVEESKECKDPPSQSPSVIAQSRPWHRSAVTKRRAADAKISVAAKSKPASYEHGIIIGIEDEIAAIEAACERARLAELDAQAAKLRVTTTTTVTSNKSGVSEEKL